jgi:hypothetical protein
MDNFELTTAVALFIFNRPDVTRRVFEEIRRARPTTLLVVGDGPRAGYPGDVENCAAARAVLTEVDWECEVVTNYAEVNMGCKARVSSGLHWVFGEVEEAIILEDDCVPHPTFFRYCQELLERHRYDDRVFHISGDHFRFVGERNRYSYYFSRYNFIWGWASWRRAWKHYDVNMRLWPEIRDGKRLDGFFGDREMARQFTEPFQRVYEGEIDTWDYQWGFAMWAHGGLSIRPSVNLISNVGFGAGATNTTATSTSANLPTEAMKFPLRHPPFMMRDAYEDEFLPEGMGRKPLGRRIMGKAKRCLKKVTPAPVRRGMRFCMAAAHAVTMAAVTLAVPTHKRRWKKVSQNPEPHWDWRNKIISGLVPGGSSVLDLGCGAQTLRRHLDPTCRYQPSDVIVSTPDVIFCDFNAGVYPAVTETYDYVICSGLFEYIRKPEEFLDKVPRLGRTMILTYSPAVPGQTRLHRLSVNWVNHFTREEMEGLMDRTGLSWEVIHTHEQAETIYRITIKTQEGA